MPSDHRVGLDRWLSVEEICAYLGVSRDSVHAWIADRAMPAHRIGRHWKFKCEDVDAWVRAGHAADADDTPVSSGSSETRLVRIRELIAQDEPAAALDACRALGREESSFELSMLETYALTLLGRYREALDACDRTAPSSHEESGTVLAHRMRLLVEVGEYREATEAARTLIRAAEDYGADHLARAANLLVYLGHYREALPFIHQAAAHDDLKLRLRAFGMFVEGGDVACANGLLESLGAQARALPSTVSLVDELMIPLRIFSGEFTGVEAQMARMISAGPPSAVQQLAVDAVTLATVRGRPAPRGPLRDDVPQAVGYQGHAFGYELARNDVRHGVSVDLSQQPPVSEDGPAWLRVRALLLSAESALRDGRLDVALTEARRAVAVGRSSGARTLVAEAHLTLADVLLVTARDDSGELAETVRALRAVGRQAPSLRMTTEAELVAVISSTVCDPAVLERIALLVDLAPVAARRARALLGGRPKLDELDRRVVEAARERSGMSRVRIVASSPTEWGPGWRFDEHAKCVVLPCGARVDFAARAVQLALLRTLACMQRATKEQLVLSAWSVREYHPLHHDKRLQVAIRALRDSIEKHPSRPTRVVTTADGYAIGTAERFVYVALPHLTEPSSTLAPPIGIGG